MDLKTNIGLALAGFMGDKTVVSWCETDNVLLLFENNTDEWYSGDSYSGSIYPFPAPMSEEDLNTPVVNWIQKISERIILKENEKITWRISEDDGIMVTVEVFKDTATQF